MTLSEIYLDVNHILEDGSLENHKCAKNRLLKEAKLDDKVTLKVDRIIKFSTKLWTIKRNWARAQHHADILGSLRKRTYILLGLSVRRMNNIIANGYIPKIFWASIMARSGNQGPDYLTREETGRGI